MSDDSIRSMSKSEQAALFLMALGENQAAEVLKHMGPKEVESLGTSMRTLTDVSQKQIAKVLDEFLQSVGSQSSLSLGSEDYLKNILQKALGRNKADSVMSRISIGAESKGLDMLKWMDAQAVFDLIRNEHPQIITIVLVYLEKEQASEVLAMLDDDVRTEVVMRIAKMDGINAAALSELDTILEQRFTGAAAVGGTSSAKVANVGGIRSAAELVNGVKTDVSDGIIEKMTQIDADLSAKIQDQMFIFENLLELDERGVQTLLREVSTDSLVVALKGASQEMQEKIFRNMSKRAAEMLRDDLETRGPIRLKEVEQAQKDILTVARTLADDGKITLGPGGEDFV